MLQDAESFILQYRYREQWLGNSQKSQVLHAKS